MKSLGLRLVRAGDAVFAEVIVNVMVQPNVEGLSAKELGGAAVEAVANAIRLAEQQGHHHRLGDRATVGMSELVALKSPIVANG